jgi:hypothetical protein
MNTEHDDRHDQHDLQPESSGIKPQPVIMFLVILTVSTIFVFFIIKGLLYGFQKMEEADRTQPVTALPEGRVRKLPPEPRLQGAPGLDNRLSDLPLVDMDKYRKRNDEKARSYGWVIKDSGIAHIPLDRAKQLIVERGLPLGSEKLVDEVETAEAARKQVLGAESSAGRVIGGK